MKNLEMHANLKEIEPGFYECDFCKGKGRETDIIEEFNKRKYVTIECCRCNGTGKLSWVDVAKGNLGPEKTRRIHEVVTQDDLYAEQKAKELIAILGGNVCLK
ncbi:hypothetical protein KAR91_16050 [Candidatus Pacearchaeota archaeon]|nr:hypothetical protein [Candidatus Pacearchaeota archaeon]